MTSYVHNKRNSKSIPEADLWKFAEKTLQFSKLDVTEGTLRWKIFDYSFAAALKEQLDRKTDAKFARKNFFNITFQKVGSIEHGTAISESDFDICVVLNTNSPLEYDSVKMEYKMLSADEEDVLAIAPTDLLDIATLCKREIAAWAEKAGITVKTKEPKDYDQLQYYMLNIDGYEYDVLPAFKNVGNSFLVIWISPEADNAKLTPSHAMSTANTLKLMNDHYYGFIEMIKVCKLLVTQWNSDANHPRIKPCTFESITYSVAREMKNEAWNSATFKDLLTEIWTVFVTQIELENGTVEALNNPKENLLEFFPKKSTVSKEANEWIQKFLAKTDKELLQELNTTLINLKNPTSNQNLQQPQNIPQSLLQPSTLQPLQPQAPGQPAPVQPTPIPAVAKQPVNNNSNQQTQPKSKRLDDLLNTNARWIELCSKLDPDSYWENLGDPLGISPNEVKRLRETYSKDHKFSPSENMLRKWITQEDPTVDQFVQILDHIRHAVAKNLILQWLKS